MTTETITTTPSQLKDIILSAWKIGRPVFISGPPGLGKSQIVSDCAVQEERTNLDIRAIMYDAIDVRGVPSVSGGQTTWNTPDWLPTSGRGNMFLDELNRAPVLTQNAFFQLILDRKLGDYTLPEDWVITAAGNRESDGGGVMKMPQALANRFIHVHLEADVDDWCKWAITHDVDPVLIAFMRFRPELIYKFSSNEYAFPTPRSWSFVNDILGNVPSGIEHQMIAGAVGHAAAVEFTAYLKLYRTLPSIDAILLNPESAEIPSEVATLYAVSAALASRTTAENIDTVISYLNRIPTEYAVASIKDALLRDPLLSATKAFTSWATSHADVI